MKINEKDLRKNYQSYVMGHKKESRMGCPAPENILDAFDHSSSREEKDYIIDHISHCALCAQEFQIARDILYQGKTFAEDPTAFDIIGDRTRLSFSLFFRKLAPVLTLTVVIILGIISFFPLSRFNNGRGRSASFPNQIHPVGNVSLSAPLVFKWNGRSESASYTIEIYDETLSLIWESESVVSKELLLPTNIQKTLRAGKKYFWIISSIALNGKKSESGFQSFIPIN